MLAITILLSLLAALRCGTAEEDTSASEEKVKDECEYLRNNSYLDPVELPAHRYQILEDCVYYYLRERYENRSQYNSLSTPQVRAGQKLPISVGAVHIWKVDMYDVMKAMTWFGHISLEWFDKRLSWSKATFAAEYFRVRGGHDIWMPRFRRAANTYTRTHPAKATVYRNGTVRATVPILAYSIPCAGSFHDYPNDRHVCRMKLVDRQLSDKVSYHLAAGGQSLVKYETERDGPGWRIVSGDVEALNPYQDDTELVVATTVQRRSATARIEVYLPMALSACILIAATFFGAVQAQMCVKMFALALQVLCMRLLGNRDYGVTLGQERAPTVFKFYEYTMLITAVSLLISALAQGFLRKTFALPANHTMGLAARSLNAGILAMFVDAGDLGDQEAEPKATWAQLAVATHTLATFVLLTIYALILLTLAFM